MNGENELIKVLYHYGYEIIKNNDKIVCPFHEDVNASLIVDVEKNYWFCFGCQESGDAFKFITLYEKELNDLQCYKLYVKILKDKKNKMHNAKIRFKKPKQSEQAFIESMDYYYNLRQDNWKNVPEDLDVKKAIKYMLNRGYSLNVLNEIGCKYTYNKSYPLVFPMLDNGTFKGWVCRTIDKEIEKKRKYLYNEGFSRATTLCGDYDNSSDIYIVEGYMDMLKLKSFGIKNVIAILGWKISNEQIQKLKKYGITEVVSMLDNDECGDKGSKYLQGFFKVKRFDYGKYKDAGELNKKIFFKLLKENKRLWE